MPTVTLPHSSPLSRSSPAIYSSLMVYRSPIATVYQLPPSLPTVHSLPTVTQLANDVQITNYYSLLTATELTSFHRAYQLQSFRACQVPQNLLAATELASCYRACQPPQSLPTVHNLPIATQLANGIQLTNYHTTHPFSSLPSTPPFPLQFVSIS